jgi:glucose dehydrogenase
MMPMPPTPVAVPRASAGTFTGLLAVSAFGWASLLAPAYAAAASGDWPLFGRDHANQRYSELADIDVDNVDRLAPAWRLDTGVKGSFQATPIVVDGVMYVSTPFNNVLAVDAASGRELWRYVHEQRTDKFCCGPANRGVAVADGRVYSATLDGSLVALDAATGVLLWQSPIVDAEADQSQTAAREEITPLLGDDTFDGATVTGGTGYSANMAPQVVGDTVLVGITGAGYGLHLDLERDAGESLSVVGLAGGLNGLRGFLVAYDARTGAEKWRWYSVQGPEWTGDFTTDTAYGEALGRDVAAERARADDYRASWRLGGGSIWTTPAVDLELGLIYIGTGNPAPQMAGDTRPGDNRDTVSLVALELDSGREAWAYQQVPHDVWGYDVASPPVLAEIFIDGEQRRVVAQASKTGWVFVHDRRTGELLLRSEPFVPQRNLFSAPTEEGVEVAPAILGGASWSPMSFSPVSNTFFVAAIHQPATYYTRSLEPAPGRPWRSYAYMELSGTEKWGLVSAIDARSGRLRWQRRTDEPLVGGVLSTAGGLLFMGEGNGAFNAYDAHDGRTLWQWQAPYGVNAPPISYSVDGRQYVAVVAGGNALFGFPTGDAVLAFALPEASAMVPRAVEDGAAEQAGQ